MTDEEREELSNCDECMSATCAVCGHMPCLGCVDDCDHPDCIVWTRKSGKKTHDCVFARCEKHRAA